MMMSIINEEKPQKEFWKAHRCVICFLLITENSVHEIEEMKVMQKYLSYVEELDIFHYKNAPKVKNKQIVTYDFVVSKFPRDWEAIINNFKKIKQHIPCIIFQVTKGKEKVIFKLV